MNGLTASNIGGHLRQGEISRHAWRAIVLDFFEVAGEGITRCANSRGVIGKWTSRSSEAMFERDLWECFSEPHESEDLPEYLSWRVALSIDFRRRLVFLGIDQSIPNSTERVSEFLERSVIPTEAGLRYAYVFERERSKSPQSYVAGVRSEVDRRAYGKPTDDLLWWWGNRLATGQDTEVLRDVFERNYFRGSGENRFLAALKPFAEENGKISKIGEYLRWDLERTQIEPAREALIAMNLIAPARWERSAS